MNLLTLRAEISCVLVIHDADWWENLQSGKFAYQLNTPETQDQLLLLLIDRDEALLEQLAESYYLNMVPQAIPALWEGIDAARLLIQEYDA